MICPECSVNRPLEDFYQKKVCYKCIFKIKTLIKMENRPNCRICNKLVPKGRSVYCGYECAEKADRAHWTRVIK